MSQILTLELNDQIFAAIQRQSENIGIPPERLVATFVEQNFTQIFKSVLTDAEKEVRRAKFERHFGAIDLGFAIDIDNESIDADLAKEYASTHEDIVKLLDVVALRVALPEYNLCRGQVGTVVEILANGAAFEVEFSDRNGRTYESVGLQPEQIMVS